VGRFINNIGKISQKNAQDIPKIYPRYTQDIPKIYGTDLFKKSLGNAIISNNKQ
jgi:hypothetical protein